MDPDAYDDEECEESVDGVDIPEPESNGDSGGTPPCPASGTPPSSPSKASPAPEGALPSLLLCQIYACRPDLFANMCVDVCCNG